MAKKTTTPRSKAAPKTEVPTPTPAAKPRARAAAPRKKANTIVATTSTEPTTVLVEPTDEEIRIRAYHRYLERGGGHGTDFEDWLEAKRELSELTRRK